MLHKPGEETVRLYQPRTLPSRGAELLLRIACGATGALVLALALVTSARALDPNVRAGAAVVGISTALLLAAFLGTTRAEHNKTRAANEVLAESIRAELRADRDEIKNRMGTLTEALLEHTAELRLTYRNSSDERHAMDATIGDVGAILTAQTKVILGIADRFKDPADQEAEWFQEAVALGRNLEREETRRRRSGGPDTL